MLQWSFSWPEYSTTESDEFEKQDGGDFTCEEESTFLMLQTTSLYQRADLQQCQFLQIVVYTVILR
jgi:hypothetical protein